MIAIFLIIGLVLYRIGCYYAHRREGLTYQKANSAANADTIEVGLLVVLLLIIYILYQLQSLVTKVPIP